MYHQYRQLFDYTATLSFWRTLEEKYRERKRKWFNLNPKEVRPIPQFPLESAVLRTTVPLDDEIKGVAASKSSLSAEDLTDAVTDKEFSDVDSELFVDPGDQRKRFHVQLSILIFNGKSVAKVLFQVSLPSSSRQYRAHSGALSYLA